MFYEFFIELEQILVSIPIFGNLVAENPIHFLFEVLLIIFTIYLLLQKSYKPEPEKLSRREEDELIDEWTPEPLVDELTEQEQFDLSRVPVVASASGREMLINGKKCLNFATNNYLGMATEPAVLEAANKAITKYGCGSCGPRGFYGTLDIHLELEQAISTFMGAQGTCVYSSAYTTATSVIPAFSQLQDFIVADVAVNHAIRGGISLSRSSVLWFKHNDLDDLERCLRSVVEDAGLRKRRLTRRWIVIEGVYADSGQIVNLPRVIDLAKKYCFRIMLDDSNALGVLGPTGRGTWEHYGLTSLDVEIVFADLSRAICSTAGFCSGRREITDHQRLNGSSYCFSASLPPYLCASAIASIKTLSDDPHRVQQLRHISTHAHQAFQKELARYFDIPSAPGAPFLYLRLKNPPHPTENRIEIEKILQQFVDGCEQQNIAILRAKNSRKLWTRDHVIPPPSLRIIFMAQHTEQDIDRLVSTLSNLAQSILN